MNVRAAWWALRLSVAPPSGRLVLLALACHANGDGEAWPTITQLADETGLHRSTVVRALVDLETDNELTVTRSSGLVNKYVLHRYHRATGTGSTTQPVDYPQPVALGHPTSRTTHETSSTMRPEGVMGKSKGTRARETGNNGAANTPRKKRGGAAPTPPPPVVTTNDGMATFLPGTGWVQDAQGRVTHTRQDHPETP